MSTIFSSKFHKMSVSLKLVTFFGLLVLAIATPADSQVKVDPEVRAAAQGQEKLLLIVNLTEQPAFDISRQEKATRSAALRNIATQLEQLTLPFGLDDVVPEAVRVQVRALNEQRKAILNNMRSTIYSRVKASVQEQQDDLQQFVEDQLNGTITGKTVIANSLGVEILSGKLGLLEQRPEAASISLEKRLQLEIDDSALSVGANTGGIRDLQARDGTMLPF